MVSPHSHPALPTGSRQATAAPSARPAAALVPAVTRALALLDLLAQARAPMGLAKLSASLQLPKSSVHALCGTLLAHGYLRRQNDGSFLIGPRVMPLADAFVAGTHVAEEFNRLWDNAGEAPEETVILSVLNGNEVVYVATRDGTRPLGLAFRVGMRLPAHLAATGKALLAWQPAAVVRALFAAGPLEPAAHGQQQDVDGFLRELEETRLRGYSVDDEGVREGVHCIGVPIFDARGEAVAGVGMCVHKPGVNEASNERNRQHILRVAQTLTQRLGGPARPTGGRDGQFDEEMTRGAP